MPHHVRQGKSEFVQEDPAVYDELITEVDDQRCIPFIMIHYPIVENMYRLGKNAFVVYCALVRFADKTRLCWPSWGKLRQVTGLGRNSVRAALRTLEDWDLIETVQLREKGEFSSNKYRLKAIHDWQPPDDQFLDARELDVQELDDQELVNKLDPVLTRSSLKLDPEEREELRAREEKVITGEDQQPDELPTACDYYDPMMPCEHEKTARDIFEVEMGYIPKRHENLHAFVHERSVDDVAAVCRYAKVHFRRDVTQRCVGYMFSPKIWPTILHELEQAPVMDEARLRQMAKDRLDKQGVVYKRKADVDAMVKVIAREMGMG